VVRTVAQVTAVAIGPMIPDRRMGSSAALTTGAAADAAAADRLPPVETFRRRFGAVRMTVC